MPGEEANAMPDRLDARGRRTKAHDLKRALDIFDPERSLKTEEELAEFFVERAQSPLEELLLVLRNTTTPQKILFTGHRGTGKSTELAKLASLVKDEFLVVDYSVKNVLNLFDLNYVDVVLSLAMEIMREVTSRKINVKREVLESVLDLFTKDITTELITDLKGGSEVRASLNFLVTKLEAKLGAEASTRSIVREKAERRLADLLEGVDLVCRQVQEKTGQRVLAVVEDLDKTDLGKAKEMFYNHALSLISPCCWVIYTFPIALRHDNDYAQVASSFPDTFVMPNFNVAHRDGSPNEHGLSDLQGILTRRAEDQLFTEDALRSLAEFSGGLPRGLIALARRACLVALAELKDTIDRGVVGKAADRARLDYQVLLTSDQLDLLKTVAETKRVENDDKHRALLHNLSVLEYRNDTGLWYDVHPIVRPLLPREG